MAKQISMEEALGHIKDGMTVMIGGFLGSGGPNTIIDYMLDTDIKDLTVISNDTAFVDYGLGKLVVAKKIKHFIGSHMGTNKETGNQTNSGELQITMVPQGTLAERIRAAGYGLGGILTPVGVGTEVEDGKQRIKANGGEYLLELPLRADIALIHATKIDKLGNIYYRAATRSFNPLMAMAADMVIADAEHIVEIGEIEPEAVATPGIFIDYYVQGGKH